MAKQTVTITVDSDIMDQIRQLNINISGTINEFLESLICKYNEDVDGINIRIENMRIDKLRKKINHLNTQLKSSEVKIGRWENHQKEAEEKKLEEEKEAIESQKRCFNCGSVFDEDYKWHKFDKGNVCHSCYLSAKADDITRWSDDKPEEMEQ